MTDAQTGNRRLELEYRTLLQYSRHFTLIPIDDAIASQAAVLRVRYRLKTPDALQVSAALQGGCEAFLTNDHALKRVQELRILLVDELTF